MHIIKNKFFLFSFFFLLSTIATLALAQPGGALARLQKRIR